MIHSRHEQIASGIGGSSHRQRYDSDHLYDWWRRAGVRLRFVRARRQSWRPAQRGSAELGPLRRAFLGLVAVTGTLAILILAGVVSVGVLVQALIAGLLIARL